MKKSAIKILMIGILISINITGQNKFNTSFYYTYGSYSNKNYSNGFAGYVTLNNNNSNIITAAFEQLEISNKEWLYNQTMLSASYTKALYPLYIKLNYSHVSGKFDYLPFKYSYDDMLHVFNAGLTYNYYLFYFGVSATYQNLVGIKSAEVKQIKFITDWIVSSKITLSLSPLYTAITDGRELSSISGKLIYKPFKIATLSFGAMTGKRAYYYDDNLLTIFNQDETQNSIYTVKLELNITDKFRLPAIFQQSEFETYSIKYFTAGLIYLF